MTSHRVSLFFYLKKSTTLRTMIHRHHNYKKKDHLRRRESGV